MYNDKMKLVFFKTNIFEDNSISDNSLRMFFFKYEYIPI